MSQLERDIGRRGVVRGERELHRLVRSHGLQVVADESRVDRTPALELIERRVFRKAFVQPDGGRGVELRRIEWLRKREGCCGGVTLTHDRSAEHDFGQAESRGTEVDRQRGPSVCRGRGPVVQSGGVHVEHDEARWQRQIQRRARCAGEVVQEPRRQQLLASRDERGLLSGHVGLRLLPRRAKAQRERSLREPIGQLRRDVGSADRHWRREFVAVDLREDFDFLGPQ